MSFLLLLTVVTGTQAQTVPSVAADGPPVWRNPRIVEELRIGVLDGSDEYIFGSIAAIGSTSDGTIFVADGQGPRLRRYSADGVYQGDAGRPGEGPGEYRSIVAMATTPSDEIAVYDVRLQRITLYSAQGEYLSSIPSHAGGTWRSNSFRVDTAGNFLVYGARYTTVRDPATGREVGIEGDGRTRMLYFKVTPRGELVDSLPVPPSRLRATPTFVLMTDEGYYQPFIDQYLFVPSPNGHVYSAYASDYTITQISRTGAPVRRITRRYEPVRLGREEKAEWVARADFYTRRGGASAGVEIPDVKPPLRNLSIDEDGRFWVHRYMPATERPPVAGRAADAPPAILWRDSPTFDVIDTDGRYLGTVTMPPRTQWYVIRGDRLWGVTRGEMDESYVVRLRLETNQGEAETPGERPYGAH